MEPEDVFLQRLEQAIEESPLNEAQILRKAGLKPSFLSSARASTTKGSSSWDLRKFAEVIERSIDYLLGASEIKRILKAGDVITDLDVQDNLLAARHSEDVTDACVRFILPKRFSVDRPDSPELAVQKALANQARKSLGIDRSDLEQIE